MKQHLDYINKYLLDTKDVAKYIIDNNLELYNIKALSKVRDVNEIIKALESIMLIPTFECNFCAQNPRIKYNCGPCKLQILLKNDYRLID